MGAIGTELAGRGRAALSLTAPGHGAPPRLSSLWQSADALSAVAAARGPFGGFVGHSFGVAAACFALHRGTLRVEQLGSRLVFVAPPDDLDPYFAALFSLLGLAEEVQRRFIDRMERGLGMAWSEASRCTLRAARPAAVLVVHDRDDRETPLAGGERVASAWPDAEIHRTTGLGHRRILRDPAVAARIGDFLAR